MKNKLEVLINPYLKHIIELNSKLKQFSNDEKLDNNFLFDNGIILLDLIEIKKALNKILISKKKEYEFELQKEKILFDSVMLDMFEFPYEYNEQQQVINGDEWRNLFEKSSKISDKINLIEECLEYIDKKILFSKITQEEENSLRIYNEQVQTSNQIIEEETSVNTTEKAEQIFIQDKLYTLPNSKKIDLEDYQLMLDNYYKKDKGQKYIVFDVDTLSKYQKNNKKVT